jgi:hypothetical protein
MCYTNIKPHKTKRKHYYKIVTTPLINGKEKLYSMYVELELPINSWIEAENKMRGRHSYLPNFKGFGVFSTMTRAERFCNIGGYYKAVKVLCNGNPRKARTFPNNVPCYIFDKIKIID